MNPNSAHLPTDVEQTIDRALSNLRDTQPPAGLNSRILGSLEQRSTAPATSRSTNPGGLLFRNAKGWGSARGRGPRRVRSLGWGSTRENARRATPLALWTTTAAAVIAIASLLILHHPGAPSSTRIARQGGVAMPVPPSGLPSEQLRVPQVSTLRPGIESPRPLTNRTIAVAGHPEQTAAPRRTSGFSNCPDDQPGCPIAAAVNTADPDAQALADLHAPSHPAPPLPLTSEERLFLRMTRDRNATLLAELNPDVRAQEAAQETTAFKSFFPEPPPLKQPLGDDE